MSDLNIPDDEPYEIAHSFEDDLNCLVTVNHGLTLEAIDRLGEQELARLSDDIEYEEYSSFSDAIANFHDDLRRAASNFAVVGLVCRLEHWINRFVREHPGTPKPPKGLVKKLELLNERLGEQGPVPVSFFEDLVNVRDSVIHGDSRAEWYFPANRLRRVRDHYKNAWGDVEVSPDQLKEAVAKAIQQVKWYDDKLNERKSDGHESLPKN